MGAIVVFAISVHIMFYNGAIDFAKRQWYTEENGAAA